MSILPTLFVSHGAPTFALEPGEAGRQLRNAAENLPTPRAILIASPHWMSSRLLLTATAQPETIHDFGGFPEALYELRYPAAGAPEFARRAIELLDATGFPAGEAPQRGLDHGAGVP